jgi:hypothetical protein
MWRGLLSVNSISIRAADSTAVSLERRDPALVFSSGAAATVKAAGLQLLTPNKFRLTLTDLQAAVADSRRQRRIPRLLRVKRSVLRIEQLLR